MLTVGQPLPDFKIVGVKPGFMRREQDGESAFETLTPQSFPGQWKVIFFYPKDFTFVCPTEIAEFAKLNPQFAERDAVVLGGSTDN
jgi:peroxiredoxin (alkyl hydroperoxide reductase subunit C)